MFCHKCGTQLPEDSGFCHKCGTKMVVENTTQQTSVESTPTAVPLPVVSPPPSQPAAPQAQNVTAIPDRRQRSVIGLCKPIFALRLIDAIGWTLLIIIQIWGGVGFWRIIWNVVATLVHYGLAVGTFNIISSRNFNSVRVLGSVEANLSYSVIGIIFYGWQLFTYDAGISLLFIGIEVAILAVGVVAYFTTKQIYAETEKNMNVSLQQGETIILKGKCTRKLPHNSQRILYAGVGALTNMRFIFLSNAENTLEWATETYGEDVPFHKMTDYTVLLTDVADIYEAKGSKSDQNAKTLTIKTKAGARYSFIFDVTIKDAWTDPNKWLHAFQKAMPEASEPVRAQ